jgi:hypothetical protein
MPKPKDDSVDRIDLSKTKARDTDRIFDTWTVDVEGKMYQFDIRYKAPKSISDDDKVPYFNIASVDPPISVLHGNIATLKKMVIERLKAWHDVKYSDVLVITTEIKNKANDHRITNGVEFSMDVTDYAVGTFADGRKIYKQKGEASHLRWSCGDLLESKSNPNRQKIWPEERTCVVPDTPENRLAIENMKSLLHTLTQKLRDSLTTENVALTLERLGKGQFLLTGGTHGGERQEEVRPEQELLGQQGQASGPVRRPVEEADSLSGSGSDSPR